MMKADEVAVSKSAIVIKEESGTRRTRSHSHTS